MVPDNQTKETEYHNSSNDLDAADEFILMLEKSNGKISEEAMGDDADFADDQGATVEYSNVVDILSYTSTTGKRDKVVSVFYVQYSVALSPTSY